MATLPPLEIAHQQAHIHDNLSTTLIVVCNLFTAVALATLSARLIARRLTGVVLGLDDYLATAASIPLIGADISASLIGHWGVGRVLIWVAQDPKNFIRIGKTELAFSVCYDWSMALGKLSILALLARVFTLHRMWFKISIYFWATWTLLWWTAGWFIIFLECRPLSTNWGVPTQCRPTFTTSVSAAAFNSVSDIGILILPQPMIWQLQLPNSKKLALSLVFLFGGFATAISFARIPLLKGADSISNLNSTYTSTLPVMFTVLEPASVLISACMPMTQGLFKRLATLKIVSYISSFNRSTSQKSRLTGSNVGQPSQQSETKIGQGQWTKLHENPSLSRIMGQGQELSVIHNDGEEYELSTGGTVRRETGRAQLHEVV